MYLVFVSVPEPESEDGQTIEGQPIARWRSKNRNNLRDKANQKSWVAYRTYYWTCGGRSFYSVPVNDSKGIELCRQFFEKSLPGEVQKCGAIEISMERFREIYSDALEVAKEFDNWNSKP